MSSRSKRILNLLKNKESSIKLPENSKDNSRVIVQVITDDPVANDDLNLDCLKEIQNTDNINDNLNAYSSIELANNITEDNSRVIVQVITDDPVANGDLNLECLEEIQNTDNIDDNLNAYSSIELANNITEEAGNSKIMIEEISYTVTNTDFDYPENYKGEKSSDTVNVNEKLTRDERNKDDPSCSFKTNCTRDDERINWNGPDVANIMENEMELEESDDDSLLDPNYESDDDSSHDSNDSSVVQTKENTEKSRKRKRQEKNWKINKQHMKVVSGLKHKSKKKMIAKKTVGPPCNISCRLKCSEKVCEEERLNINAMFWDGTKDINQKRQFVASHVKVVPIFRKRRRTGARNDARNHTRHYYFEIRELTVRVCRTFFHNTLNISQTFVTTALNKKEPGGIIATDGRGKHDQHAKIPEIVKQHVRDHILKFPVEESHYSRERSARKFLGSHLSIAKMYRMYQAECEENNVVQAHIAKEWLYAHVFNTEFNLSFKYPDNDTCDQCDYFLIKLREVPTIVEKDALQKEYNSHLEEASKRYKLKKEDKQQSLEEKCKSIMICVDMQKCLPTPVLTNSQSFYSLKLWTYNYTVYNVTNKVTTCVMWDECKSGRGANEMASGMLKWAMSNIKPTHENLIIWSDNCPSQNRNLIMVMVYFYLLKKFPSLKRIEHKFLLRGHTHLEVDACHSLIEREKKKTAGFQIMTPWDWQQIARMCSMNNPFEIINMEIEDFKDFKQLFCSSTAPFISRKKDTTGSDFAISKIVVLQVRAENHGILYFKTNFDEMDFHSIDLIRTGRRATFPAEVPNLRFEANPLSLKKFKHLQTLLKWIPKQFHDFYKNIKHANVEDGEHEDENDN